MRDSFYLETLLDRPRRIHMSLLASSKQHEKEPAKQIKRTPEDFRGFLEISYYHKIPSLKLFNNL